MAAALVISAGTALGASAAQAAPNASISVIPTATAQTPHGQFDPFNYVIDFSCSGASGAGCTDMEVRIPVTLEPRAGQVEQFQRWTMTQTLSNSNAAAFTTRWEQSGTTRTLVLTARGTIAAGVAESVALQIIPASWVGDDVKFTVGQATLTTSNGDPATSNAHTATVTNRPLNDPTLQLISGHATDDGQFASYSFDPMLQNIVRGDGTAFIFGRGDTHTATGPNVTAQYGTIELSATLPLGAEVVSASPQFPHTFDSATGIVTFTVPAAQATTDTVRFTVFYPQALGLTNATLTANRTFVASNGDHTSRDATVTHPLNFKRLANPTLTKCGGANTPTSGSQLAGVQLPGMCNSNVMMPTEWTNQGTAQIPRTGYYTLTASNVATLDAVTFRDSMPCFNAVGTVTGHESYRSAATCASPAVRIVGVSTEVRPENVNTLTSLTSDVTYRLTNSDGTIVSPQTSISGSFPAPPATGSWHTVEVLADNVPIGGAVVLTIDVVAMPGVDRAMVLENYGSVEVQRSATDETFTVEQSPRGLIRVLDIVPASTRANLSYTPGRDNAGVGVSYTIDRLNPNNALPIYTLQMPAGFGPYQGDLRTFQVQYNGAGSRHALTDHFDVTVVPEDAAAASGFKLLMTPKLGTTAVPVGGAGWPQTSITAQIAPTWGAWNTRQTVTSSVSVNGPNDAIDVCTQGAATVLHDATDHDGDGVIDPDYSCFHSISALLGAPSTAATAAATKSIRDASSTNASAWHSGTDALSIPSGTAEYQINWRNAGTPTLTDVVMYDIFPSLGDTGATSVTQNQPRGSEFALQFAGLVTQNLGSTQVLFSASDNPCRSEVLATNPGCVDDWATDADALGGNAAVKAMKIVIPGAQVAGANTSLSYRMALPATAATGEVAWNTVAHSARLDGIYMSPAETARVGASVPSDVTVGKAIGDGESESDQRQFAVGDIVTYTLTAQNEQPTVASNVLLSDDLSEVLGHAEFIGATASKGTPALDEESHVLTWQGDLAANELVTVSYQVRITSPLVGALMNQVTGTLDAQPTNCETGDESGCSVAITVPVTPGVSIDKVAPDVLEGTEVLDGTVVTWEYRVTNTGNEPLVVESVADDRLSRGAVVCPVELTLPVGGTMTCEGSGVVTGASPYANTGIVVATGEISDRGVNDSDTWTTPVIPREAGIGVVKSAVESATGSVDSDAVAISEGSELSPNQRVTWVYTVTNTGTDPFRNVYVTDDQGVSVSCPNPVDLAPGASVDCTGTGAVGYGAAYTNVATAQATGTSTGVTVTATDDWSATVRQQEIGLEIVKSAPGIDPTQSIPAGTTVNWEYVVTNPGTEPIGLIAVTDDRGVLVVCPANELAPGASMTCTGSGSVGDGESYANTGAATGVSTLTDREVAATDTWTVAIRDRIPGLSIEKGSTDAIDGGTLLAGSTVQWNYTVRNTGEEPVSDLTVVDDQGVAVTCPVTTLDIGATTTCIGSATIGNVTEYTNIGTASAVGDLSGDTAEASDDWNTDVLTPETGVDVLKYSTDHDFGAVLQHGALVNWEYAVTNAGSEPLVELTVLDDKGVSVVCPVSELAPGATIICTGSGPVNGDSTYTNVGTASAVGLVTGTGASADDFWTSTLVTPFVENPSTTPDLTASAWPIAAVNGSPVVSAGLALTGGAGIAAWGVGGLIAVLLGLGVLLARRRVSAE